MWISKPNKSQFKSNFLSSFLGFVFQVNHRILGISILRSVVDPLIEWIETPWADFVINQLPACHRVIRIGNQTNPDSRTKLKSGDDYTFCAQCMDSSEPILQRFFVCKNQVQFAQNAGSCCLRQAKWCEIHSRGLASGHLQYYIEEIYKMFDHITAILWIQVKKICLFMFRYWSNENHKEPIHTSFDLRVLLYRWRYTSTL